MRLFLGDAYMIENVQNSPALNFQFTC